jgi:hypothetical protein
MPLRKEFTAGQQTVVDLKTRQVKLENTLDFAAIPCGASDVVEALKVPANCLITSVCCYVITAEGGTSTATVGDGVDPDGWDVSINLNSAGPYYSGTTLTEAAPNTWADAYAPGKFYTVDDTIDLTLSAHAVDAAKVVVVALGVNLEAKLA